MSKGNPLKGLWRAFNGSLTFVWIQRETWEQVSRVGSHVLSRQFEIKIHISVNSSKKDGDCGAIFVYFLRIHHFLESFFYVHSNESKRVGNIVLFHFFVFGFRHTFVGRKFNSGKWNSNEVLKGKKRTLLKQWINGYRLWAWNWEQAMTCVGKEIDSHPKMVGLKFQKKSTNLGCASFLFLKINYGIAFNVLTRNSGNSASFNKFVKFSSWRKIHHFF